MSGVTVYMLTPSRPRLTEPYLIELVHDAVSHVDRDSEADADVAAAAREDGGVDADQLASQIDERAAGVARIDRGVGLDEILVAVRIDSRSGTGR